MHRGIRRFGQDAVDKQGENNRSRDGHLLCSKKNNGINNNNVENKQHVEISAKRPNVKPAEASAAVVCQATLQVGTVPLAMRGWAGVCWVCRGH